MGLILDVPTNLGLRPPAPGCVPGVDKAPQALRSAGLHEALSDQGWREGKPLIAGRYRPETTPGQVRNQDAILAHAHRLADVVNSALIRGDRCLLLGGDCSTPLGVSLGLARRGRYGLVHIDGHTDFRHPGNSDAVANLAGEDLACATGFHYRQLSDIDGLAPYITPGDVIHAGCRDDDAHLQECRQVLGAVFPAVEWMTDERRVDSAFTDLRDRTDLDGYWVHVDVDVLDPSYLPAVDSPDPEGITPDLLTRALAALWRRAAGMTVGILDPDLDPDGRYASLITGVVLAALGR